MACFRRADALVFSLGKRERPFTRSVKISIMWVLLKWRLKQWGKHNIWKIELQIILWRTNYIYYTLQLILWWISSDFYESSTFWSGLCDCIRVTTYKKVIFLKTQNSENLKKCKKHSFFLDEYITCGKQVDGLPHAPYEK